VAVEDDRLDARMRRVNSGFDPPGFPIRETGFLKNARTVNRGPLDTAMLISSNSKVPISCMQAELQFGILTLQRK